LCCYRQLALARNQAIGEHLNSLWRSNSLESAPNPEVLAEKNLAAKATAINPGRETAYGPGRIAAAITCTLWRNYSGRINFL